MAKYTEQQARELMKSTRWPEDIREAVIKSLDTQETQFTLYAISPEGREKQRRGLEEFRRRVEMEARQ